MKNKNIIISTAIALVIGFTSAWLIKSSDSSNRNASETQTSSETENDIWTCSMHPQIRQNEPGQCPICGMDLIPLDDSNTGEIGRFEMTPDAVKLANIQTTVIGGANSQATNTINLNGKIQADETQSASIVAHIPGRIEQLYISYTGERVVKGQKIASIYSPDLITAQKELLEVQKIADVSPSLLEASKNKLKFWKISDSSIDEILQSGKIQENFIIYADYSGIVTSKNVSVGDYIKTGTVLFNIQNLQKLWVLFDVYENELANIKVGNKIEFSTTALPGKLFTAKINFVDPVINPSTRTASIRAEVNNKSQKLKPEMFVLGKISTPTIQNSQVAVPKSAVLWTGTRSVVYIKTPDTEIPSFEYREITLGNSLGASYEVLNGLNTGDEVVTNGAFVIDASAQLNNQTSMMNRQVNIKPSANSQVTSALNENASHEIFTVYGNCEMCKKTIEKSLTNAEGIFSAEWNIDSKQLHVSFDSGKMDLNQIKQKIADVGYDTDSHRATDEVYNKLPKCCQFERPK